MVIVRLPHVVLYYFVEVVGDTVFAMQMCIFTEETASLLDDIFFIKKVQTIREFFDLCCKVANTLYGVYFAGCFTNRSICFYTDLVSSALVMRIVLV